MFTQAMPALAQALQGVMPAAAVRQLMQTLGNCNQPLEHRGPISFNPDPLRRESGPGYYGGGAWSPEQLAGLLDGNRILGNSGYVDFGGSTNNFFGGDSFLFNNNSQFITNNFPTQVVIGQPGSPGRDGSDGRAGADGRFGRDGVDGAPGAAGEAGRDGFSGRSGRDGRDGRDGEAGAAGAPGQPGADGLPGPPGRPGRDGLRGGYQLQQGLREKVDIKKPLVFVPPFTVKVMVPTYTFDAEECEVVQDGEEEIESEPVELDILVDDPPPIFVPSVPRLVPKDTYP
jgi:hypothetical protein